MHQTDDELSWPPVPDGNVPINWVEALLSHADLSARIDQRVDILRAAHHATNGTAQGLSLALTWLATWEDCPGRDLITRLWANWPVAGSPATFATLCQHVEGLGLDSMTICGNAEPGFAPCGYALIEESPPDTLEEPEHPLARFSLTNDLEPLRIAAATQKPFLADLAIQGQCTVLFAEPGTGKTLLTLRLLCADIQARNIVPSRLFFFDLDDNLAGLLEKAAIAKAHNFHLITEGHRGFQSSDFPRLIDELIEARQCRGVIIVVDTLKKVLDIMDKAKSSSFGKLMRRFSLRGGTVLALAHTNKRRNSDGEPIYAGMSDILEDFDCAYIVHETNIDPDSQTKTIVFKNKKSRGSVRKEASFQYSVRDGLTYEVRLDSISEVSEEESLDQQRRKELSHDLDFINIVRDGIRAGIDTKMAMVTNLVERSNCRKRYAIRLIERYEGNDPEIHRWNFRVGHRGAKVYFILGR